MFHYVYLLENDEQQIRAGYTLDLSRSLPERDQAPRKSWRVIYCEAYLHLSDAMRRVKFLKSLEGLKLIKQRLRKYLSR